VMYLLRMRVHLEMALLVVLSISDGVVNIHCPHRRGRCRRGGSGERRQETIGRERMECREEGKMKRREGENGFSPSSI
jgi:hypothetical protein